MINILVVGEICEDRFIYGKINRLSPEAPVPIIKPVNTTKNRGMSGNVVDNLLAMDSQLNILHWHQTEQIIKTRIVDIKTNHMFIRIDEGEENIEALKLTPDKIDGIKKLDFTIVSDYNKGFLNENTLLNIAKSSKLSILDSKRKISKDIIDAFTFIKLNENEYIANKKNHNCENILVTLGERGAMFNEQIFESPNPQQTIDVSGAGDTFTASFILQYFKTKDIISSIKFANKMSSIVVSKKGVATP
jgi:bifunctional ADP-heptose synthase (sugar kinase/adenylyltransferase)